MGVYFISGSPYSEDELYHYGIPNQKWYVRRFQNLDRTWTEAGKIRYGAKKAGDAVGKAVKSTGRAVSKAVSATGKGIGRAASKTGKHVVDNFKSRHPWMMSDDELNDRLRRVNMEKSYQQAFRDTHKISGVKRVVGSILENGARTLANAAFNKLATNMVKNRLERANDKLQNKIKNKELREKLSDKKSSDLKKAIEVMRDPDSYSAKDIQDANNILKNLSAGRAALFNDKGTLKSFVADTQNSTVQEAASKPNEVSSRKPDDGSSNKGSNDSIPDSENELLKRYRSRGASTQNNSSSDTWGYNVQNSINLGRETVDLLLLGYS